MADFKCILRVMWVPNKSSNNRIRFTISTTITNTVSSCSDRSSRRGSTIIIIDVVVVLVVLLNEQQEKYYKL